MGHVESVKMAWPIFVQKTLVARSIPIVDLVQTFATMDVKMLLVNVLPIHYLL
jgi:hypothetical protein